MRCSRWTKGERRMASGERARLQLSIKRKYVVEVAKGQRMATSRELKNTQTQKTR